MAHIFNIDPRTIEEYIRDIYASEESLEESTSFTDPTYKIKYYNLDMMLAVSDRIIRQKRQHQFQASITTEFYREDPKNEAFSEHQEISSLLSDYAEMLERLEQYDTEELSAAGQPIKIFSLGQDAKEGLNIVPETDGEFVLEYTEVKRIIEQMKKELGTDEKRTQLFGQEKDNKCKAIVGNIYQTFDEKELYPSLEEKAAHLLYFMIKDHPFVDGNKRIASFVFVYFLYKNSYWNENNPKWQINKDGLMKLAIMTAGSYPKERDKLTKIIIDRLSI